MKRSLLLPILTFAILLSTISKLRADQTPRAKSLVIIAPRSFHGALGAFVKHKQKFLSTELVNGKDLR